MLYTVEKLHRELAELHEQGVNYIDGLVHISNRSGVELETISAIVRQSRILIAQIKDECVENKTVVETESETPNVIG